MILSPILNGSIDKIIAESSLIVNFILTDARRSIKIVLLK
jgi:hypothetical protein